MKYDFVLLDKSHLAPGEFNNIIGIIPFLNEKAIIILPDIKYYLPSYNHYRSLEVKFHPIMIY